MNILSRFSSILPRHCVGCRHKIYINILKQFMCNNQFETYFVCPQIFDHTCEHGISWYGHRCILYWPTKLWLCWKDARQKFLRWLNGFRFQTFNRFSYNSIVRLHGYTHAQTLRHTNPTSSWQLHNEMKWNETSDNDRKQFNWNCSKKYTHAHTHTQWACEREKGEEEREEKSWLVQVKINLVRCWLQ